MVSSDWPPRPSRGGLVISASELWLGRLGGQLAAKQREEIPLGHRWAADAFGPVGAGRERSMADELIAGGKEARVADTSGILPAGEARGLNLDCFRVALSLPAAHTQDNRMLQGLARILGLRAA